MCMAVYLTNGQNNDELNERKYQRAQSLGKTSVVIVLAYWDLLKHLDMIMQSSLC